MNWHNRYLQQAGWTRELRAYLFQKAGLSGAHRVLEVGCGTGAILLEGSLPDRDLYTHAARYGVDLSAASLAECRNYAPGAFLTRGDALYLPYLDKTFDISYCHFLLLWVDDPLRALQEMKRVTIPQGYVLALAEPDYTSRVDWPREISWLGKRQTESLFEQGADVGIGSRLADLFYQAGINILETGTIQNRGKDALTLEEWENEWSVLQADLAGTVAREEIQEMKHLDEQAWKRGEHEMIIPTYFAWGQV
jgi:ubiquinone/menaquinone biosynthesis C-methylase UbiE